MVLRKYTYYAASVYKLLAGMRPRSLILRVFLGLPYQACSQVELVETGLKFKVRGAMDIWSVKETFLDHFYQRFGAPIQDGWTVVDIGGGIGDFTLFACWGNPRTRVIAFEPFPQSFTLLQENLRLNGIANATAYPQAVWNLSGELAIDTTTGEPGQYVSREVGASQERAHSTVVPAVSLADAFNIHEIEHCDLLKLDCEGAEYPILYEAPQHMFQRIERILMEYHDNQNGNTHQQLARFLEGQGYKVQVHPNFVHSHLGYLYAYQD